MHDMGYPSQVGNASQSIRDANGVVLPVFHNLVQKIRTPALKGLRFNRFVTDSQLNTKNPCMCAVTQVLSYVCLERLHNLKVTARTHKRGFSRFVPPVISVTYAWQK
jgi:hypothetical protein